MAASLLTCHLLTYFISYTMTTHQEVQKSLLTWNSTYIFTLELVIKKNQAKVSAWPAKSFKKWQTTIEQLTLWQLALTLSLTVCSFHHQNNSLQIFFFTPIFFKSKKIKKKKKSSKSFWEKVCLRTWSLDRALDDDPILYYPIKTPILQKPQWPHLYHFTTKDLNQLKQVKYEKGVTLHYSLHLHYKPTKTVNLQKVGFARGENLNLPYLWCMKQK